MPSRSFAFGAFVLDPEAGTILRRGEPVPLGYRAFLLLTAFLNRPGEVLTKGDLIDAAWQGAAVEETNLSVQIASLRKHLGQSPVGGEWIATVHRVGYRFIGPVDRGAAGVRAETGGSSTKEPGSGPSVGLRNPGNDRGAAMPPQEVRYVAGAGGVQLAYAVTGSGYPVLKCGNWMSDLQYDRESSVWAHWIAGLSARNQLIRYDQRGNGLSDRNVDDLSFDAQLADLEAVADAACVPRFALLGVSAGAALSVAYAVRHPDRVSHLILYAGRDKGWRLTGGEEMERRFAMASLIRNGWGQDIPAFRQLFSSLFIPDGTPEQMDWYNDLQRRTVSPENAARLYEINGNVDVSGILDRVMAPTLVLHASGDALVHFDFGRALAIGIPNARFVLLDSRNHILLSDDPAFDRFLEEVRRFVDPPADGPAS